ncbi:uncharacterized protein BP5553_02525 [Venustampulla echinocandica]|uniref:Uncharacterized protein n=1 Tax=Venustampulla echinocandica TaxID=2656787 RepID=A0A370U449_9HELO|nr:uncharacterized protein BP5553_02525 [Venustampulla echinocandica]RDL42546.1 hypothetical protein BP5553_02525 [Venustampulla echinocandica]
MPLQCNGGVGSGVGVGLGLVEVGTGVVDDEEGSIDDGEEEPIDVDLGEAVDDDELKADTHNDNHEVVGFNAEDVMVELLDANKLAPAKIVPVAEPDGETIPVGPPDPADEPKRVDDEPDGRGQLSLARIDRFISIGLPRPARTVLNLNE